MPRFFTPALLAAALSAAALTTTAPAAATPLDPLSFASLGSLQLSSGNYEIVTGASGSAPQLFDASHALLFSGTALAQAGGFNPSVGVFSFDSIAIGTGVHVAVTGSQPLALLSRSSLVLGGTLDASGFNGANGVFRGPGGAGGLGNAGGADGGLGGSNGAGLAGTGPGAGPSTGWYGLCQCTIGVGGGYGGRGLQPVTADAGLAYGDVRQTLQGGSGGSGSGSAWAGGGGGGGGGGAVELGALSFIDVTSTGRLFANGGSGGVTDDVFGYYGGGGSGGGVLLHAASITLDQDPNQFNAHALIAADGGAYNGSGGRIAFLTASGTVNGLTDGYALIEASVGTGPYAERGVITIDTLAVPTAVPEPASALLLLLGLVTLVGGRRLSRAVAGTGA